MPLLARDDVPEHVRTLTSHSVLAVEADLVRRFSTARRSLGSDAGRCGAGGRRTSSSTTHSVGWSLPWRGPAPLLVVEGAAGTGKTTALAATRRVLELEPPAGGGHPDPEGGPRRRAAGGR